MQPRVAQSFSMSVTNHQRRLYLPHFSRFISARSISLLTRAGIWFFLGYFIYINVYTLHIEASRNQYYRQADSGTPDVNGKGTVPDADARTLGVFTISGSTSQLDQQLRLQKELSYWESVLTDKPDYRDAHIAAAALWLNSNQQSKAKLSIRKALEIDPNNITAQEMDLRISSELQRN